MKRICVFCGSRNGTRHEYIEAARSLGSALAGRKLGLVYGGGDVGLMGVVARAAVDAGGDVIGVIPDALVEREIAFDELVDLRVVSSMHERKALMNELSDAFIALPGGLGTLEETFEIVTWGMLGIHSKPLALFDVAGFYDPLLAMLDHCVAEGFVHPEHRRAILHGTDADEVLDRLQAARRVPGVPVLGADET